MASSPSLLLSRLKDTNAQISKTGYKSSAERHEGAAHIASPQIQTWPACRYSSHVATAEECEWLKQAALKTALP
jgi:hypothetical protein